MKKISENTLLHSVQLLFNKRQSGFTIVELMVVMTIIAILATMGAMGYKGYLKQTRDATRIDDLATLDAIIFDFRRSYGKPPSSDSELNTVVMATNHGQLILDPINGEVGCITSPTNNSPDYCGYTYTMCDNGDGYVLSAKFESSGQVQYYTPVPGNSSVYSYNVGHCTAIDIPPVESVPPPDTCTTKADCQPNSVCVGPPPKTCRLKSNQGTGAACDTNDECNSNKCKKKVCTA